ncbi:MAG: DsbA family protein [Nannocystaceae bacterium]|nr:DsbA family protein [bacterium]
MLIAGLLAMTACSPACTPPEAKSPDGASDKDGAAAEAGGADAQDPKEDRQKAPPLPKGEMIMEAKGVDLSKLSESQRSTFFQIINSEPSACDKPHSLATSLRDDDKCRDSLIAAQFVADYLEAGAPTSEVRTGLQEVTKALQPREIPVEGRPVYGSENAPVTVVVFADFQCPHCKMEAPKIRKTVDQFRGRAKLIFKHFPLQGHPRAKAAAIATEAALEQGKFWEMHDKVFANQDKLEDGDILSYASQIGLDMDKFKASYNARKGKPVVEADKADGEKAGVDGTPAVFVNGRRANGRYILFGGELSGWIDDALKR